MDFFFFFCLLKHRLYTHLCVPSWGFLVVRFHYSGCFPLYCPWLFKWTAHSSLSAQRQTGLESHPNTPPHLSVGLQQQPPNPKHRQVLGGDACPWVGISVSSVGSIICCGWTCIFPLNHHCLVYEIQMALKLLGRNVKSCYSLSCASRERLLSLLQNVLFFLSYFLSLVSSFGSFSLYSWISLKFQTRILGMFIPQTSLGRQLRISQEPTDLVHRCGRLSPFFPTPYPLVFLCYRFSQLFPSPCP